METHFRPAQIKSLPQGGEIQDGNTGNHQNIPPTGGMGHLNTLQGCLLPYTNTGTLQEISEISCPRSHLLVQGSAFSSVHSTLGVYCGSKGGETNGHAKGYKNPPVPRRLVGEGQVPPRLSPAYQGPGENVSRPRLTSKFREIRTGTKTSLQLCRLPVRPQVRSAHNGPVADPQNKDSDIVSPTGLSGQAVHVPDRSVNSHRKASSPRQTTYETHTMASQKQLESTRITRKGHSNTQILAPPPTVVVGGEQHAARSTITPSKTCSADLYRRIKRRVGRSLKRAHGQRFLVTTRKQAAHKLSSVKGSLSGSKRVPRPLRGQDSSCSNRQHYSSVIYKQGRRHEVGATLCPAVENLDLVYPLTSDSQSPTHPRPPKCGSRQAIPARPDNPDRVVSPSRGFSNYMQQVEPASSRPYLPPGSTTSYLCLYHQYRIP